MPREERSVSSTGGQKGVKLAQFNLIPTLPLELLAEHFGKGAKKYDRHQWRKGYEWSKSYDALTRHLNAFWGGQDYDICSNDPEGCLHTMKDAGGILDKIWDGPEDTCWNHTGSHHMQAVMWHAVVLMEFVSKYPDFDDRFKDSSEAVDTRHQSDFGIIHLVSTHGTWDKTLCCNKIFRGLDGLIHPGMLITLDAKKSNCLEMRNE